VLKDCVPDLSHCVSLFKNRYITYTATTYGELSSNQLRLHSSNNLEVGCHEGKNRKEGPVEGVRKERSIEERRAERWWKKEEKE
jgi:hypothetical protein